MIGQISNKARPFVKWVGGKTQLLEQFKDLFPKQFNTYFEPFVGGGAVFFYLQPNNAHINDINKTLINTYKNIKDNTSKLIKYLSKLEKEYLTKNDSERRQYYLEIRSLYNSLSSNDFDKSLYFLFLNRTGFNGMYRENSKGQFNIPFGKYINPKIVNKDNLIAISELLKNTRISSLPFYEAVKTAKTGDFVYFDPPYYPLSETSSFTSYHGDDFSAEDQIKLRDTFIELDKKGVFVMLSNSNADFIKDIYKGYRQIPVLASRMINSKADGRGKITELVILNY